MRRYELKGEINCTYYLSEQCRTWIAAKTIFLLAPDEIASSTERLDAFAASSGWLDAVERDGAVFVLPLAKDGWKSEPTARIKQIYKAVWADAQSPDPGDVRGTVWCWETLIFLVGFDEGAGFAGNCAVAHPNMFADVAMVNGVPDNFSEGEQNSDQWLLPDASPESMRKNREIPVSVLMLGNADTKEAEQYFRACATSPDQLTVSCGDFVVNAETTKQIMAEFDTRIRWKNSPDGTPARCISKEEFERSGEYVVDYISHNGFRYPFYARVPKGVTSTEGMPVVISLHGHGESARLFSGKNGWPQLSDETGEFLLVLPDSPENAWHVERDEGILAPMIEKLVLRYGIDRSRVYLTGFSNGGMGTCWFGTRHPALFAAISPWNPPMQAWENELLKEGFEMPLFAVNGDKDHKIAFALKNFDAMMETYIRLNGGTPRATAEKKPMVWAFDEIWNAENTFTREAGYREGERLKAYVYHNEQGSPRVCFMEVKDMPHGAIHDEARATWRFLRRFSRSGNGKKVIDAE
ncbi:MAG TPA: hypothetical protein VN538_11260 [Clostridia bacterium]|nr:hypothetical protein [Clostridia bacterium]